jgi:hypothetical protein
VDTATAFSIPLEDDASNTSSPASFFFIKACMESCEANHKCMSQVILQNDAPDMESVSTTNKNENSSQWPSRLIHVRAFKEDETTKDNLDVRLVEVKEHCPRYACLSHCWGGKLGDDQKTTESTLAGRMGRMSFEKLPRTFQDAINITRNLGLSYLWIDALCIVQDSLPDWQKESLRMGAIYSNSYITIAASSSSDSTGGCFREATRRYDSGFTFNTMGHKKGSRAWPFTIYIEKSSYAEEATFDSMIVAEPLSRRGWVCQERVLSPRAIHYTANHVLWECRQFYATDDISLSLSQGEKSVASIPLQLSQLSTEEVYALWYNLIADDYSKRKFTIFDDRSTAIYGLAKMFQSKLGDEYVAGLWKSNMAHALSWRAVRPPKNLHNVAMSNRPSWSWTSHDAQVEWRYSRFNVSNSEENLDLHGILPYLEWDNATILGEPESQVLEVSGMVVDADVHLQDGRHTVLNSASERLGYAYPDCLALAGSVKCLVLFMSGVHVIVLLCQKRPNGDVVRVGLGRLSFRENTPALAQFVADAAVETILLS